jgi:hypothetical protein
MDEQYLKNSAISIIRQYANERGMYIDLMLRDIKSKIGTEENPLNSEEKKIFKEMAAKWKKEFDDSIHQSRMIIEQAWKRDIIYNNTLIESGWPPFASTYMWNINDIVELVDKYKDNENKLNLELNNYLIQELECNNFQKLDTVLSGWLNIPKLAHRGEILHQIINAHKLELFALSIPAIIIQIEGIIPECFSMRGKVKQSDLKQKLRDLVKERKIRAVENLNKSLVEKFGKNHEQTVDYNIIDEQISNNPLVIFFENRFDEHFEWRDGKKHENSRHAILHGKECEYATKINAVKMIHLLDYLINLAYIDPFAK